MCLIMGMHMLMRRRSERVGDMEVEGVFTRSMRMGREASQIARYAYL